MSDTTETTPECERTAGDPTGIARCGPLEEQDAPFTVHGVAIGAGDITLGEHGQKLWPADELRRATQTLVGVPLTKNHDDESVESVIGEVVDAGFQPDVGVIYEAEVDDRALATKIARGRLEVSIHAVHADGGRTDDGQMIAEQIRFLDLSVVPRGAAPSNSIEPGASQSEALASLSTDEVATLLADADADVNENHSTMNDDDNEAPEQATEADATDAEPDIDDDVEEASLDDGDAVEAEADAESEAELEEDVEGDVEAEEADTSPESTPSEVAEGAELREEIDELRAENEELRHELEDVRMEYAERLADDGPFTATELAAQFPFDTLKDKFESQEASLAESTQPETPEADDPAPRTGDVSADEQLSTSPDEHADRIAELEAKVEQYEELGMEYALDEAQHELSTLRE